MRNRNRFIPSLAWFMTQAAAKAVDVFGLGGAGAVGEIGEASPAVIVW